MKKFLIVLSVLLIAGLGISQRYSPNPLTLVEINTAANFTDGRVVPCPRAVEEAFDNETFILCVDASNTNWSQDQLADWSDYGLGGWSVVQAWKRNNDGLLTTARGHPQRGELIGIGVFSHQFVLYLVLRVDF